MPYRTEYVPAELALEHKGVRVYHAYKNDESECGPRTYWFVLDPEHLEEDAFDIRDLELPDDIDVAADVIGALRVAIDLGLLPLEE